MSSLLHGDLLHCLLSFVERFVVDVDVVAVGKEIVGKEMKKTWMVRY